MGSTRQVRAGSWSSALVGVFVAAILMAPAFGPVDRASGAVPAFFRQVCPSGSGAGECVLPRGIAVDSNLASPSRGHVFVSDQNNARVNEFTAWGAFVKTMGWAVADGLSPGLQSCSANCFPGRSGTGAGQLSGTQGLAVDGNDDLYALGASRVQKFNSSGQFLLAFGGDVVSSGPDNTGANEQQTATVKATGGKFSLSPTTATGNGRVVEGSATVTAVTNTLGAFRVGDAVTGTGISPNTTIAAVSPGTVTLSQPASGSFASELTAKENTGATATGNLTATSTTISGIVMRTGEFAVGERISGTGIPVGTTIASVIPAEAKIVLSAAATATGSAVVLTATDIAFNATAAEMQAALEALPGIGAGNVAVSGGPGNATGTTPYTVAFTGGLLAHNDVATLTATTTNLEGTKTVTFATPVPGGGPEICKPTAGDVCKGGRAGVANGELGTGPPGNYLAAGPGNTIYVGDVGRIEKFQADGTFVESIAVVGTVKGLALDPATGGFYAAFNAAADVLKLSPAGATVCTMPVPIPTAVAYDPSGGTVYAFDESTHEVVQFTSACADKAEPFATGDVNVSTGLATGAVCGNDTSVYLSSSSAGSSSFVNFYGALPNPATCPRPQLPPDIVAQYAVWVDTHEAMVRAEIDPRFWEDAAYYVQYGTASCIETGGWEDACVDEKPAPPGIPLGAGIVEEDVTTAPVFLSGLEANTDYRYRFVAQSGGGGPVYGVGGKVGIDGADAGFGTTPAPPGGKADCANQAFRVGPSAALPDCRAYEMVSPVDKNNGDVVTLGRLQAPGYPAALEQSAADGEKIAYSSARAFADAIGAPFTSQYIATRGGAGWSTHGISPLQNSNPINVNTQAKYDLEFKAFTEDLCQAWLVHNNDPLLAAGGVEGYVNLYRRDNCGPAADGYGAMTTVQPPATGSTKYWTELQGFSADGDHAFFTADDKLTSDAAALPDNQYQLYESTGGQLRYVCVLPDGTSLGAECTVGTANAAGGDGRENTVAGAVSADGSRVFWSAGQGPAPLLLRENPDQAQSALNGANECTEPAKGCTVLVSLSPARFWAATPSGSKAIYTVGNKLFELDADKALAYEAGASHLLAEGLPGEGVVGTSEDLSRVYFISTNVLTGGEENSEGDKAAATKPNLYLYDAETESFTYVTTLSSADVGSQSPVSNIGSPRPVRRAVRVSPDGGQLAFVSTASLTGYDNVDLASGERDAEVFLYEGDDEQLVCVSCNPTGSRPSGRQIRIGGSFTDFWAAAQIPVWENQLYASRALSDDGARIFFESTDPLLLADTNSAQDVYQWLRADDAEECEAAGTGRFVASAGGCLSLISTGESPVDSEFADASPDGRDAFIRTASKLVPQDPGQVDMYDARIGGGFPPPPAPTPPCAGEACQGSYPGPPEETPASSSFEGAGSPQAQQPKRCGKGKIRRHGRCVKKKKHGHAKRARRAANENGRVER
jgi:hypothetical protein